MYALVVVQNRGKTATEIHEALQTLVTHIDEKHHTCLVDENSCSYFQKKLALTPTSSHIIPSEEYLSPLEMQRLRETFYVFTSISFCECITLGKTQNPNKSLHNLLWHNAPKFKRVGQASLKACIALAILSFNDGSTSSASVLNFLGISPRSNNNNNNNNN